LLTGGGAGETRDWLWCGKSKPVLEEGVRGEIGSPVNAESNESERRSGGVLGDLGVEKKTSTGEGGWLEDA
jgi:hypothetical protein